MPEKRPGFPISPRTLGLIVLVIIAILAPLLRPLPDETKKRPADKPHSTATRSHPAEKPKTTPHSKTGTAEPSLSYTQHGRERFAERHISEEDALEVLTSPDKREHEKPGEDGGEVYKYIARVHGKPLVIVAEAKGQHFTVITGYWDD